MQVAPLPPDEAQRLSALRNLNILDTQPEERFDRITRLAAALLEMPIVLISLVDSDRRWFKSAYGSNAKQIPRNVSFCSHAILDDSLFIVPDAQADSRFADNPLVMGGPLVRFYAGRPLKSMQGQRVGTLCVMDRKPRILTPTQLALLEDLACIAEGELNSHVLDTALRVSEERMRIAVDTAQVGIWERDLQHHTLTWNDTMYAIFGARREEFPNPQDAWVQRLHPQDLAIPDAALQGLLLEEHTYAPEFRIIWPNGEVRTIKSHARLLRDPSGRSHRLVGTNWDITDDKRRERNLAFLAELQRSLSLLHNSNDIVCMASDRISEHLQLHRCLLVEIDDTAGQFTVIHDQHKTVSTFMTGSFPLSVFRTKTERQDLAEGKTLVNVDALLDERSPEELRRFQERGVRALLSTPYLVNGRLKFVLTASYNKPHVWPPEDIALLSDLGARIFPILERSRAEQALSVSEERLRLAADAARFGMYDRDLRSGNFHVSTQLLQMLGYPRDAMPGHTQVMSHMHPDDVEAGIAAFNRACNPAGDGRIYVEQRIVQCNGSIRWIATVGRLLFKHGEPTRSLGFWVDITDRKEVEEALRASELKQKRAMEAAETASRIKSEFLSTMSHEIRTPLNGVMGMVDLLLNERLTPQQRQYAELADSSAKSLLGLIDDLLDLGKIEAGQIDIEHVPFNLNELLIELSNLYRLRARDKGLTFTFKQSPDVPSHVLGDPGRLRQILNNLLVNALKFTRQGEFGLSIERVDWGNSNPPESIVALRFSVHDTGIGIAPDEQKKLFTRFSQVNSSTTSEYSGSGLGLAIVRQLCERMDGTVKLVSTPNHGSIFSCELRFTQAVPTTVDPVTPAPEREYMSPATQAHTYKSRILVAEDNPINQVVAQALLQQMGYTNITMVENGQEAVEAVLAGEFDAVLMDCRMPIIDGYAATEEIRAMGYHLPIIAMTANAAPNDLEKCLRVGMNDYISKPFNAATLRQALTRWTAQPDTKPQDFLI
jgi:PAS domain S-box-containing protein